MRASEKGFTLVETLAALAVTALISGGVIALTGQWLSSWTRAAARMQATDRIASLLVQMREDIGGAVAAPSREGAFRGTGSSLRFLAPHASGLESVAWRASPSGLTRAARLGANAAWRETEFGGLQSAGFEFLGVAGDWRAIWQDATLPQAVRITLRIAAMNEPLVIVAPVRARLPAVCARATSLSTCEAMAAGQPVGLPQPAEPGRARSRGGVR